MKLHQQPGLRRGSAGRRSWWHLPMLWLLSGALAGCASILPKPAPQPAYFTLQGLNGLHGPNGSNGPVGPAGLQGTPAASALSPRPATGAGAAAVLLVQVPAAAPGFDSARIIYTRQPHRLEYFAQSEWVDSPARMLAPIMVSVLDHSGTFRSVVLAPSAALGDLQLDTQLLRLQQEFGAARSQVRLSLRAQLIDTRSRRVLATRDFEHTAPSASEDAAGGVAAAQRAAHAVLRDLSDWCREVAAVPRPLPAR